MTKHQTTTMKFTTIAMILGSATTITATPIEAADDGLAPIQYVNRTGLTGRAAFIGCIIRTYAGSNCDGRNFAAYEYTPEKECRSCRSPGGDAHSFRLEENCPFGKLWAFSGNNCNGDNGAINMRGPGCYNVNTGYSWNSFAPCFGQ